jgi:adenylate cyclase
MLKLSDRRDSMTAVKRVERRLAAILAADVVSYSRLMGADEIGTLRALQTRRRELIDPTIAAHQGRIVKTTGDGLLVEFPSAVEAVACAISIQQGIALRNEGVAEDERLVFRIGINVGDIISEAGDIFGDGVNVAARLESLCEAGGLCISRAVRDQVRDKLPVAFDDLGEQQVKNIVRPVRAFGLTAEAIAATPELAPQTLKPPAKRRGPWVIAVLAAATLSAGSAAWWMVRAPPLVPQPSKPTATASVPVGAGRASIAVLPLEAIGAESGSDYFADGLTEDIIAALGRFRDLTVMSLGSVFAYKGKHPPPAEVGRDLKVRYVVEGFIRRGPERIRVSVSLTDTNQGNVLWSEKHEAEPKDIFAVQDQITRRISGALALRVTSLELARSAAKPPSNLEAYDLVLRGRELLSRLTRSANAQARDLFERATALDPGYVPAYVGLGQVNMRASNLGWTQDPGEALERAERLAQKAIALDDLSSSAHALLGDVAVRFGDYDRALEELKRAIDLNGSDAESYGHLITVLLYRGDTAGAIAAGELLAQFQPEIPDGNAFDLGMAYVLADRGADAVRILERVVDRSPGDAYASVMLAAAYATVGRQEDAERQARSVRQRFPTFPRDRFGSALRDPSLRAKLNHELEKAGL